MPFKSPKQERWMWMNEPEMARKWYNEHGHAKGFKKKHKKKKRKSKKKSAFYYLYEGIVKISQNVSLVQPQSQNRLTCKDFDTTEAGRESKLRELFGSTEEEFQQMDDGEREPTLPWFVDAKYPDLFADIDYATRERDFPSVEKLLNAYYYALENDAPRLKAYYDQHHDLPEGEINMRDDDDEEYDLRKYYSVNNWYKTASATATILALSGPNVSELIQYLTIKCGIPEKYIMTDMNNKSIRLFAEDADDTRFKLRMKFPDIVIMDMNELQKTASKKHDKVIAVDFDNTIAKDKYPDMGKPEPDVVEALQALKNAGYKIEIFTCRTNKLNDKRKPYEEKEKITEYMNKHKIPFDKINMGYSGKPFADYYIDDKAITYEDNWLEIAKKITGEDK